jgi:membrane-associated tyrosine/threonine-specific cdc2-inhibitory kinase
MLMELGVRSMGLDDGTYSKRRLPEGACWNFLIEVLLGLRHMHRLRIVHCDIKPDNILVGTDGRLKIADFGIAHFADVPKDFRQNGDLFYAPVEVIPPRTYSGTSVDIFSLGFSTLELLTGTNLPSLQQKKAEWFDRVSDYASSLFQ